MKKLIVIIVIVMVGIAFSQTGTGVIRRFINLTDTPSTYSGQGGKVVAVNSGATALEFISGGTGDLLADGTVPLTANWDAGNFDITLKSLTGDGTIEGATITEGGQAVWNASETDILDSGHYIANSIDNEHINWADIDNLGDEGAVTLAATTTALATARTIAGVSFDGTGNIAIASTGLSDTAALLYETELDDFSELDGQISDKSLVNMADGATWLGVHTFGGATTVIPWKVNTTAAPTVEGQAIWESDTDELTVGDGSVSVVIAAKNNTVFCFNIHDIDSGMDDIKMPFPRAVTITKVTAFVTGGTNVVGRLYEVDGDGDDSDAVGVESSDWTFTTGETEDSSFNNATFDAGDYIQWDTTSVSGSVAGFMISVEGYEI